MPGPYEQYVVLPLLHDLNRQAGPIPARVLADFVGKSERMARNYLARLERVGLVERPHGIRNGWAARA